ncbi:hypothetical protein Maeo_1238 [Methanococcus aeolicus Nankai-3]|uniref:LPXTG cell wall anchor domain-containing protein n=1 Tax=Methanococcus aeolicus (strain ATCC BAA-1280 / DSM 17508 / OCM 812 / Nankai-3) TaxID=419665 RepID=A6UWE2_META3|nr:hypothetical protein [Methanococcus aeolicus]ABR56814.1 hypothetical protein Maeo_1238 [Methanococcus aeolicus Nankai-3]
MLPVGRVARRMNKPRPHRRPTRRTHRRPTRRTHRRPTRRTHRRPTRRTHRRPTRRRTPPHHIKASSRTPKINSKIPKIRVPKIKVPKIKVPKIKMPKLRRTPKLRKGINEPNVSKWDKLNGIVGGLGIAATGAELYMMSKWMGDSGDTGYEEDGHGDMGYGDGGYGGGYGDGGYGGGYGDGGYGGGGYMDSLGDALGDATSDYLPDSALDPGGDIEDGTLTPTDDGGYVDGSGNYYTPDPETGELINPETGQPYIPKSTKYTLVGVVLVLILIVGVWIYKKRKKGE